MEYITARVPYELILGIEQWVAYELRENQDKTQKPRKVPINPHTGAEAKSNDASTWGDVNEAERRARLISEHHTDNVLGCGIGLMFGTPDNPSGFAGIDLDHCFNDDGTLQDYAADIVQVMDSYTEKSPSGKGLHILYRLNTRIHDMIKAVAPQLITFENGQEKYITGKKNTSLEIEIYDSGRFFTVTGNVYQEHERINERTEQARQILQKYFIKSQPARPAQPTQQVTFSTPDKTDAELWDVMYNSQAGATIRQLYSGDYSGYKSQNEADLALCRYLVFYTGGDYSRIENMFGQSALGQRDKWKSRPDYRQRTINLAIASTYDIYTGKQELRQQQQTPAKLPNPKTNKQAVLESLFSNPKWGHRVKSLYEGDTSDYKRKYDAMKALMSYFALECGDNESLIYDLFFESGLYDYRDWQDDETATDYHERINYLIDSAIRDTKNYLQKQETQTHEQQPEQPEVLAPSQPLAQIEFSFSADYLDSEFEGDIKAFQKYSGRKTGFSNLDGHFAIYPALYAIGAVSSLGKTTINLQLADNFAGIGEHVLYFALEQSRFELVSKSLARLCQPEGALYESAPSAIEIRNGRITPELRIAIERYKQIARHYSIIECDFETTASTIIDTIHAYIEQYGVKPVVFIDYLQLVRSSNPKLTNTKDVVDDVIRALKKYQKQNELVMFVISSLNRQNYLTPIDFESFKESGAIEYTADVVIGMQLAVMNKEIFETDTKTGEKRKVVKAAKKQTPRHIELCILKNRYGISNESFYFQYYPKFDLFMPSSFEIAKEAADTIVEAVTKKSKKG